MAHVFISYSHQDDKDFFAELKNQIEAEKIEYWTDEKISPGALWSKSIDDAIKDAFAVVVLISPLATKSQYITYEWSFALGQGKIVIPVVIAKGAELHPKLSELQHIDFTNKHPDNWNRLMAKLRGIKDLPMPTVQAPTPKVKRTGLNAKTSIERRHTILAAADAKNYAIVPELITIIQDILEKPSVREAAAKALGILEAHDGLEALIFLVRNTKGTTLRQVAADSLGKLGDIAALSALIDTLIYHFNDAQLRKIIVRVFAQIARSGNNQDEVIARLQAVLYGSEPDSIKPDIADALKLIGTQLAKSIAEDWKRQQQTPPTH